MSEQNKKEISKCDNNKCNNTLYKGETYEYDSKSYCSYKCINKSKEDKIPHPPTDSNWNWEGEFREYFDKTLKPKKPTMANLDRELCIDFIRKILAEREAESREKMIEEIERTFESERPRKPEGEDILYDYEFCRVIGRNQGKRLAISIIKNKEE